MFHYALAYAGLFLGVFLEGELVFLSAVIAAHNGLFNIWVVVVIAMLATITSDIFYFNLGRKKASEWINTSKWAKKLEKVQIKLGEHRTKLLLTYRFLYGFRIATPLLLGTQPIPFMTFLKYSVLSTTIWAVIFTTFGWLFGELILTYLNHIQKVEYYIIGGLLILALLFFIYRVITPKKT